MRYVITTVDMCVQGFERLRRQDEFILNAYPSHGETGTDLLDALLNDIETCARPDDFDYTRAREAVRAYFDQPTRDAWTAEINATFGTPEAPDEDADDDGNPVVVFCYVRDMEAD